MFKYPPTLASRPGERLKPALFAFFPFSISQFPFSLPKQFIDMPHNRFRLLLLFIILHIYPFSSKGSSDHLLSSPSKKCNYPCIIGCLACSHDNLMGYFFDTQRNLFYPDFRNFLEQEILSDDLCEGMIEHADIFGLSSLLLQLVGEGSHRQLVTTMVFSHHHPKFSHFVNEHSCEAIVVQHLPTGLFSDPFELQHLVSREVFLSASVLGDTNLELPSTLSNRSAVEIHIDVKIDTQKIVFELPLHSRYPPLDSSGYSNITVGTPDLFMRCKPKNSQTKACSWTLIDFGISSVSNVVWRIPCGNEVLARPVTLITFLSALICSLLIVLSSLSKNNKSKIE